MTPTARLGLAGAAMIAVSYGFGRYGYGLFAPRMVHDLDLSVTAVGVIASVPYAAYLVAIVLVGPLSARWGPRRLVVLAGLASASGTAMVAYAPGPAWVVVGLTVAGSSPGWAWAPYSDAADRMVPAHRRDAVLGVVATGTAFGVAFAGPLAILLGDDWRWAWWMFAALAFVTTVANVFVVPAGPATHPCRTRPVGGPVVRRDAVPLYVTAAVYGFVAAGFWTFAVTLVEDATGVGAAAPAALWSLLGAAGTAAVLTGPFVTRIGLRATHAALLSTLAAATALLGLAPANLVVAAVSVAAYGAVYMAVSGLLAIWSYRLVPDQPARAFSVTVFFLGVASIPGPVVIGAFADRYGLRAAFLLTAAVTAVAIAARPRRAAERHDGPSLHAESH